MFDKIKMFLNSLFHKKPEGGFVQAQDYPHRPGGSGDVGDLADVRLTSPVSDSQLLTYDATARKWVNLLLYRSAGFIDYIPSVPDGSGAITFSTNQASLYDNSTFNKSPKLYTLTGGKTGVGTVPALADNTVTYLVGDYNGGSPKFSFITNVDLITESFQGGPRIHSWEELKYI